jgi:hypothetical protein
VNAWEPDSADTENALVVFAIAVAIQSIGFVRTGVTALTVLVLTVLHSLHHHHKANSGDKP